MVVSTLSNCWILPIPYLSKQGTPVIVYSIPTKATLGTLWSFTLLTYSTLSFQSLLINARQKLSYNLKEVYEGQRSRVEI